MPGPDPKPSSTRARRNKTSTAATLVANPGLKAPPLPGENWHSMTESWWGDVWSSPMAPEFDGSDKHGLFMLARLVDAFWVCPDPKLCKELAAEIRQQGQRFGLSPIDRRRLQWEIEHTEEAQDQGKRRRAAAAATGEKKPRRADPRAGLHAV